MVKVSEHIKSNTTAKFLFYRSGELWYQLSSGLQFPVPIEECGDAIFNTKDRGVYFMRWVRKQLEKQEEQEQMIAKARQDWEAEEKARKEQDEADK